MHRAQAWRIINAASSRAGVWLVDVLGRMQPVTARDFRHGAAVNQIRQGVPVSEVQQQLGHARLDTTAIYLRLANPERRATADGVMW
jgi:integrase